MWGIVGSSCSCCKHQQTKVWYILSQSVTRSPPPPRPGSLSQSINQSIDRSGANEVTGLSDFIAHVLDAQIPTVQRVVVVEVNEQ